jgi:hypothetical protein
VGASRRDDYERVVIGRLGDSGRALATRAGGRADAAAVPEPIRVRDPWQVEAGVETARALAGLGGVTATAASGDPAEELARFVSSARRGATGRGRDERLGHGATDRGMGAAGFEPATSRM